MGRGRKFQMTPTPPALELIEKMREHGHNFKSLAGKAGVGPTISRWAHDTHPRLDIFYITALALGYDVKLVPRAEPDDKPGT